MTHFSRILLTGSAALALLFAGCQAKTSDDAKAASPVVELASDVSKDELVTMMKDAIADAKSTAGSGKPSVWTFSDDDTTVYMFGTVHLLKPDVVWRSPELDALISKADTFVLEADITSPESQASMQQVVMEYGIFSDGQTLSSVLEPEDKAVVEAALQANNIPIAAVETMKPWMVSLQFAVMQMMKAGYDPESGVESLLMAEKGDKEIAYLETGISQIKALGGAPMDAQVQGLLATIGTMELGEEYLDTLVAEWADGDVRGIGALMANPAMMGSQEAYDALLKTRNRNWVPGIKALLDEPGVKLVAVGAGHLAGPDSVVTMLKDDGVKVKVVK